VADSTWNVNVHIVNVQITVYIFISKMFKSPKFVGEIVVSNELRPQV